MSKKLLSMALALIIALMIIPAVPAYAWSEAAVTLVVSEDAHVQMWGVSPTDQNTYNYGGMNFLKVCRPNGDATSTSDDATYGRFGELTRPPDGQTIFLKFALTGLQRAKVLTASGVTATVIMTRMGYRGNQARSTSQQLIMRMVGNNWTEGSSVHTAPGGSTAITGNYMRDPANGLFTIPTSTTNVYTSTGTFDPQTPAGFTTNTNANAGAGSAIANAKINTDIASIFTNEMPATERILSLAVSANDDPCQSTYFVSREGETGENGSTKLTNANAATAAPRLTLALDYGTTVRLGATAIDGRAIAVLSNGTGTAITGTLVLAAYNTAGALVWLSSQSYTVNGSNLTSMDVAIPSGLSGCTLKTFAWNASYLPAAAQVNTPVIIP